MCIIEEAAIEYCRLSIIGQLPDRNGSIFSDQWIGIRESYYAFSKFIYNSHTALHFQITGIILYRWAF